MTTKSDLEFMADKLNIKPLKVVWLKDADVNYRGPQIINLGHPNLNYSSHWVATYDGKYFDSFGLVAPQKIEDAGYEWIPLQIQKASEGYCGQWCLIFLYYAKMNEIDRFYNLFQNYN